MVNLLSNALHLFKLFLYNEQMVKRRQSGATDISALSSSPCYRRRRRRRGYQSKYKKPDSVRVRKNFVDKGYGGIYICYLLETVTSKGRVDAYVGITNNPCKRLRMHNRELCGGAIRTAGRTCRLVGVMGYFYSAGSAEQFEIRSKQVYKQFKKQKTMMPTTKRSSSSAKKQIKLTSTIIEQRIMAFKKVITEPKWKHAQLKWWPWSP